MRPASCTTGPLLGLLLGLLSGGLLLGGCTTSFEPLEDGPFAYSLYGVLDAAADTQFIYATPIRPTIDVAPESLGAVLTAEHLGTGRVLAFRDSLVRFGDGRYGHLLWTAEPIEPDSRYRLDLTRGGAVVSTVLVTVPSWFPPPVFESGLSANPNVIPYAQSIQVELVERLADLHIRYLVRPGPDAPASQSVLISYLDRAQPFEDGWFVAPRMYQDVRAQTSGCPVLVSAQAVVAAGGPEWALLDGLSPGAFVLPDSARNVEGGLGFVGGIYTQRIAGPLGAISSAIRPLCLAGRLPLD